MNQAIRIPLTNQNTGENSRKPGILKTLVVNYKASKAAKRITKSLKEVKDFESGKKQPKSFDDFLNEI